MAIADSASLSAAAIPPLAAVPSASASAVVPAESRAPGQLLADGEDFRAVFGPRRYRLRGLVKNADVGALKVGLRLTVVGRDGVDAFHQDTVDLCQAKQRAAFVAAAVDATKVDADALKSDLGKLLDWSEAAWATHRLAAASSQKPARPALDAAYGQITQIHR